MSDSALTVCVITRGRPPSLDRLLTALGSCELPDQIRWERTLIVDNDAEGSAAPIIAQHSGRFPVDLDYVVEAEPGVSAARNRAVNESRTAYIAFIDDDMTPSSGWLLALVEASLEFNADCVVGPVPIAFESAPPPGLSESGALDFPNWAHGEMIETLRTGNTLLRRDALPSPPFDSRMAQSGGEDHLLGKRLAAEGRRIVFAQGATATEWTPPERLSNNALRKRQRRIGFAFASVDFALAKGPDVIRVRIHHAVTGVARVVAGTCFSVRPLPARRRWRGHQLRWFGVGQLSAIMGRRERYYAT